MKKVIFLSLVIALIIGSCAEQESKFPQGAWQLVQIQRIANGKTRVTFPTATNKGTSIKMWSEKHYSVLGNRDRDTLIVDLYTGGTYKLEGIQYEEDVMYAKDKPYIGKNIKMSMELRNDTLLQSYNPVNTKGQFVDTVRYVEKYIRLK
jgi:hypothetical protein